MVSNHIFSCKTCDHSCHYGTDYSTQYGPKPMTSSRLALPIQEFKIGLELKVQMFGIQCRSRWQKSGMPCIGCISSFAFSWFPLLLVHSSTQASLLNIFGLVFLAKYWLIWVSIYLVAPCFWIQIIFVSTFCQQMKYNVSYIHIYYGRGMGNYEARRCLTTTGDFW